MVRLNLLSWVTSVALIVTHMLAVCGVADGVALERGTITTYHTSALLHHTVTITCHVLGDGDIMEELEWRKANGTVEREKDVLPSSQIRFLKAIWLYRREAPEAGYGERDLTVDPRVSQTQDWYTCNLTITQVQAKDEGLYRCIAINLSADTTDIYLTVHSTLPVIEQTPEVVEVEEGGVATLDCPAVGHMEPLVTWRRQDRGLMYVEGKKTPRAVVTGRRLKLTDVRRNDAGNYTCTVSTRDILHTRNIRLAVLYLAEVWATQEMVRSPLGASVTLECEVYSYPPPSLQWKLPNGTVLPGGGSTPSGRFTLTLHNLTTHQYGWYSCKASNPVGESEAAITLYGKEEERPVVVLGSREVRVMAGHSASLVCDVHHPGHYKLGWFKRGSPNKELVLHNTVVINDPRLNAHYHLVNGIARHHLTIQNARPSDAGTYVCQVSSKIRTSQKVYLRVVVEEPNDGVVTKEDEVIRREGEAVKLRCPIKWSEANTVTWRRLDNAAINVTLEPPLPLGSAVMAEGEELHFPSVNRRDAATYTCTTTTRGPTTTHHVHLVVHYGAEVEASEAVVGGVLGARVVLKCLVKGSPPPTLTWTHLNGSVMYQSPEERPWVRWHEDHTMMWLPLLTPEAFTTYLCTADNYLASSQARVTVFELPSRVPEVKEHDSRSVSTGAPRVDAVYEAVGTYLGTAVVLECTAAGHPRPSVSWSLNHEDVASQCEVTAWTPLDNQVDTFLTISNVTVHHLGNYTCWASNSWGQDQHSINLYDVLSAPASIGAVGGEVQRQGDEHPTPDTLN
ncbi:hemicentin-1-like isoform X2 [Homarus americanus]|uniref:hemicentin-1-like isoform X2 n=1 Tax=Homarus americanus TaxID=6706 RepID=UPI001C48042D|nr:hemicentin-1-like isoform X2 [Homarus americanus]